MKRIASERGQAMIMALGLGLVASILVAGLYTYLKARATDVNSEINRIKCQYLAETAVSAAVMRIHQGLSGSSPWTGNFNYASEDGSSYPLSYTIATGNACGNGSVPGQYCITGAVGASPDLGFKTCQLVMGGTRAFPFYLFGSQPFISGSSVSSWP